MPHSKRIQFQLARKPIKELRVKFGGQPVWVGTPAWPLSCSTGKPMQFIAQIPLSLLEGFEGQDTCAYLFMADDSEEYVDGTWEPDGGENCLLLMPSGTCTVETQPISKGPSLYEMKKRFGRKKLSPASCEYSVEFIDQHEPEYVTQRVLMDWPEANAQEYTDQVAGSKMGGVPGFLQNDEFPSDSHGDWLLALQIDSTNTPFSINLGDAGIGYAFVKADGTDGRFLWQCC